MKKLELLDKQLITISTRQLLQGQQEHGPFGQQLTEGQHAHIFKARTHGLGQLLKGTTPAGQHSSTPPAAAPSS